MQYKQLAAVAAFAGFANAQSQCASIVPQIPACLLGYVASAAYYGQGCDIPDIQCQAGNSDHYMSIVNTAVPDAGNGQPGAASTCGGGSIFDSALSVGGSLTDCAMSNSAQPPITLNALQSACEPLALSIPPCALGFIAEVAYSSYSCAVQDFECQCSNFANLQGAVANDVIAYCGVNGLTPVINSANALCSCVTSQANGVSATTTGTGPTGTVTTTGTGTGTGSGTGPTPSGSSPTGPTQTGGPTSSGSSSKSSGPSGSGSSSKSSGSSASGSNSKSSGSSASGSNSKSGSVSAGPSGSQSSGASKSNGSPPTTSGPALQSSGGNNGGSGSNGGSRTMSLFTNAGATASAFGGIFGVVAGVVAFL